MKRITRTVLPVAAGIAILAPLAPSAMAEVTAADETKAKKSVSKDVEATAITRSRVIARAKVWLTAYNGHQVPYSQSKTFGGYRQDCSGYVSAALKYGKPGTNTVGLASSQFTRKIKMKSLKKGDLVIDAKGSNTTRHVVIFERWANSSHSRYWAYEQRGGHGTDHRKLSYGLGSDQYDAYRPKKY